MGNGRKYTKIPCGLRLRLDMESDILELKGDMGQPDGSEDAYTKLTGIVTTTENLMALSAFFLARAQESDENA